MKISCVDISVRRVNVYLVKINFRLIKRIKALLTTLFGGRRFLECRVAVKVGFASAVPLSLPGAGAGAGCATLRCVALGWAGPGWAGRPSQPKVHPLVVAGRQADRQAVRRVTSASDKVVSRGDNRPALICFRTLSLFILRVSLSIL